MLASLIGAGLMAAVTVVVPIAAEDTLAPSDAGVNGEAPAVSPDRLAAGVREYPAGVLRSLLLLSEDPLVLRQLADEPALLEQPDDIRPPVSPEMHAAIRELSMMPAIVAVAADHPTELKAVRELYSEAPAEMEERILQLRVAYDQAALGAAVAWQKALERDPAVLKEYSELVTRFCKAQRENYEGYPCVQVSEREYYYACPPNEAIILYAIENAESSTAMQVIEQWWETYAPYELDSRILSGDTGPVEFKISPDTVAAMPPEQRASMWSAVGGDYAESVSLVPVIMQTPADLPLEALYARAVAEHARLWTPEMPLEAPEEPSAEATEERADSCFFGAERGDVLVDDGQYFEEPLPEVVYDDAWDYTSDWTYGPATYSPVRYHWYHTYYAPIAVYYCGYPVDWPVFYGCDPGWLVRYRICIAYTRCGHRGGVYWSYRSGSRPSACFYPGGYCDWWGRRGSHPVVRVGRRHYQRCTYNQIAHALRHRRTYHHRTFSGPRLGDGRRYWAAQDAASRVPRRGARQDGHVRHSATYGEVRARTGSVSERLRSIVRNLNSVSPSTRRGTSSGIHSGRLRPSTRIGTPNRGTIGSLSRRSPPPSRTLHPSASGHRPSIGTDRISRSGSTRSEPRSTVSPRSGSSRRGPSVSSRPPTISRPRSTVSPRSSSSRRGPSVSPRPPTGSRPRSAVSPRSSSSRRGPSVSSRPPTSSRPRSSVSPRSSSSRRGASVSSRPPTSSRPRSSVSPRRSSSSGRSSSVSSRSSRSSRPRSAVSRSRSSSSRGARRDSPRR